MARGVRRSATPPEVAATKRPCVRVDRTPRAARARPLDGAQVRLVGRGVDARRVVDPLASLEDARGCWSASPPCAAKLLRALG